MIDTVHSVYNYDERKSLYDTLKAMRKEYETRLDALQAIDDDDEYDSHLDALESSLRVAIDRQYLLCFSAQFRKTRNEWFANVITGYTPGEWHSISKRQYDCFSRYANQSDDNTWRDGCTYCRCGDFLVTLKRHNAALCIKKDYIGK